MTVQDDGTIIRTMRARWRLVTANLRNGHANADAFAALIRSLNADVVAVQEISFAQVDRLAAVMPFGKFEPDATHRGMGIGLRYPGSVWRLPLPCRDAFVAEFHPPDRPLHAEPVEILNVHVAAPHILPPWHALRLRRGQLRGLLDYLVASPARCRGVVGDLNSTSWWPLYRRLAGHLTDAAVVAAGANGGRPARTWGPWPGAPRLLRIDHILTQGLTVQEVRVVPIDGGDHSALVADLSTA
jgi:endonuclease/exonuclease/phosphatase (EEP) superfamily protein YafD